MGKGKHGGYASAAQRKAAHASMAENKGASMKEDGASKKDFPEIKEKNQGKFTKWVEKNMPGTDTCKAASKIMRSKTKKYPPAVVKMANYANNFGCKTKKDGSSMSNSKKDGASMGGGKKDGASEPIGGVKDLARKLVRRKKQGGAAMTVVTTGKKGKYKGKSREEGGTKGTKRISAAEAKAIRESGAGNWPVNTKPGPRIRFDRER